MGCHHGEEEEASTAAEHDEGVRGLEPLLKPAENVLTCVIGKTRARSRPAVTCGNVVGCGRGPHGPAHSMNGMADLTQCTVIGSQRRLKMHVYVVVGHSYDGALDPPAAFTDKAAADAYLEAHKGTMNLKEYGNAAWVVEVPLDDPNAPVDW